MNLLTGLVVVLVALLAAFVAAFIPPFVAAFFGLPRPTSWWLTSLPPTMAGLFAGVWAMNTLNEWQQRREQAKRKRRLEE